MRAILALAVLFITILGSASAQTVVESPYQKAYDAAFVRCGTHSSCRVEVISIGIVREQSHHRYTMIDVEAISLALKLEVMRMSGERVDPTHAAIPDMVWNRTNELRAQTDTAAICALEEVQP